MNQTIDLMIIGIALLVSGIIIGYLLHHKKKLIRLFNRMTDWSIFLLLFFLGVSVGMNKQIISNLETIGLQSLFITIAATVGSIMVSYLIYRLFFKIKRNKDD